MKRILTVLLVITSLCKCQTMDHRMISTDTAGNKVYTINTAMGYTPITKNVIERNLILVDDNKVWNPNPVQLLDSDYVFIKSKLPDWLKKYENLNDKAIAGICFIEIQQIKSKIKYVFTDFFAEEEDVYLLKLNYENTTYRIYFCIKPLKYIGYNESGSVFEKNKLLYPFEDEEWNKNFYETKEEYLEMRTKEEDGYNKYFSNPK